ncbi:MAG: hypothetical protein CMJ75_08650 [Planctomycetaceae bacterium]|nr:hypothetical protein [Planctomycetaceae bacterium]
MQPRFVRRPHTRTGRRVSLLASAALLMVFALYLPVSAELRFYASFDETLQADFASGAVAGLMVRRGTTLVPDGKWGRAVRGQGTSQLAYDVVGNLNLNRGTLEFFARFDPFDNQHWKYSLLHVSGVEGMELAVSRQGRSAGIVLGWKMGKRSSWVANAQRFVYYGTWQHYALTWDLSRGPGQGSVSVFVDGTRRVHVADLDPFTWSPDQLFPASTYTGASIDDLAIYDDVRYEKDFQPRQKALRQPAAAADLANSVKRLSSAKPFGQPRLINGDFEDWEAQVPLGWHGEGNTVLVKDARYRFSGAASLLLKSGDYTERYPHRGLTSNPLALVPNRSYRLRAWVSTPRTSVGDLRFDIRSSDGRLVGSYSSGWSTSHGWLPVDIAFRTNDCRQYTVRIYLRRHKNEFSGLMWIDDVHLEMRGPGDAVLSADDRARGFYLFSRSVMETSRFEQNLPTRSERIDQLSLQMGRGEYEPAFLGLYAVQGLRDVDLRLSGDLVGPAGARLDVEAVTVRRVQESLLPRTLPRDVERGEMLAWWVTVKTSRETVAGGYKGMLHVTIEDQVVAKVPLQVRVIDVPLPAPRAAFLVYHHELYIPDAFLTPALRRAYYRDMVAHGMNTVTIYNNADVDGEKVDFSHNTGYPPDDPRYAYGLAATMRMIRESGLCADGQPVLWLTSRFGEKGYSWGGTPEPALQRMLGEWRRRKWPEPLFYATDEPGGTGPRAAAARELLTRIKSWGLPIRTTTAGLDPETLGKYFDVWIQGEGGVSQKSVQLARQLDAEVWTYTCHGVHQNMPFPRALYGFWAARTEVRGVASWAYYDNRRWTADARGYVSGDPATRLSQVCVSPTGPIPTLAWEAIREGVDDYRYLQFLRDLMGQAERLVAELNARGEELLTAADRLALDRQQRQRQQRVAEIQPPPELVRWEAETTAEQAGAQAWLARQRIAATLSLIQRSTNSMLAAIPFDAMATRAALAHGGHWSTYAPPLGPMIEGANMRTIAEDQRRLVASHIVYLQHILAESVVSDDTPRP